MLILNRLCFALQNYRELLAYYEEKHFLMFYILLTDAIICGGVDNAFKEQTKPPPPTPMGLARH